MGFRVASIILFLLGGLLMLIDALHQLGVGTAATSQNTISALLASIAAGVLSWGDRK